MLAATIGDHLAALRMNAATLPLTQPFGSGVVVLGEETWQVDSVDGEWRIAGINAVAEVLAP